jgi:23S rRNA (guanosine2251-2'-O)-methyltransferase
MIIYGIHSVLAQVKSKPQNIQRIWIQAHKKEDRLKTISELASKHNIQLESVSKEKLDEISNGNHQGVICVLQQDQTTTYDMASIMQLSLANNKLILVLDGITDPHNLGACIRSADAFGVDAVIIPQDRSAQVTPVVHKVSCGASQNMPVTVVSNLARALTDLKEQGFWIYGLAGEADEDISSTEFITPTVLVLGAEESGLRRLTKEHCDFLVKIPMLGTVESLNVSVATGVSLFEVRRQRALQGL